MPGIPYQNGATERKNHTFMNMIRSMLENNELPLFLWSKTLKTIMYIHACIEGSLLLDEKKIFLLHNCNCCFLYEYLFIYSCD